LFVGLTMSADIPQRSDEIEKRPASEGGSYKVTGVHGLVEWGVGK